MIAPAPADSNNPGINPSSLLPLIAFLSLPASGAVICQPRNIRNGRAAYA